MGVSTEAGNNTDKYMVLNYYLNFARNEVYVGGGNGSSSYPVNIDGQLFSAETKPKQAICVH